MSGSLRVQIVWNVMAHHWMRLYCPERSSHSVMVQHHTGWDCTAPKGSHSVMMQHHTGWDCTALKGKVTQLWCSIISRKTNTTVRASSLMMKCLSRSLGAAFFLDDLQLFALHPVVVHLSDRWNVGCLLFVSQLLFHMITCYHDK